MHDVPDASPIRLFNTKTKSIEIVKTRVPNFVAMYHCGPTVYHFPHIGNMRSYVLADTLRRLFEGRGYTVQQVINITDVGHLTTDSDTGEDKVEEAAKRAGTSVQEITDFYTAAFLSDIQALNIRTEHTLFPKATDHIQEQIDLILTLERKGHTYVISDGVYFDTSTFHSYGSLGNIDIEGLKAGARIEENKEKRNITDFALWKFSVPRSASSREKSNETSNNTASSHRLQEWNSPWGVGFPGWHIECSAMSMKYLGASFDIHTGGIDHIPVHHNNEIAQSECATGLPYASYWLHNAFITIDGQKMSKSLNNTYTIATIKEKNLHPLALRYFFLSASYRVQVNFSWEALQGAENALNNLYDQCEALAQRPTKGDPVEARAGAEVAIDTFIKAISDDLNTPHALAILWNTLKDTSLNSDEKRVFLIAADEYLGLNIASFFTLPPQDIHLLAHKREKYRQEKNFKEADTLKKELETKGYTVRDTDTGPIILRKR